MRIAVLADIHGNLPALEAVIADLHTQAPDAVYLAGDQICRVPWHNEVMAIVREQGWPGIFGNHEWVIGRIGTPNEIAELIVWLCSDRASFVTGANIAIDGGYFAQ
jgi:NAD(P)-dependent dehydrogenase (short-subunit alcohol dehydrogenase family)